MIIQSEEEGVMVSYDRLVKVSKAVRTFKSTKERVSQATETCKLVKMTTWGEMDGLLLGANCGVEVG